VDLTHTQQVLLVPVAGREDDRLVEEVVNGVQQLLSLLDYVTRVLKFLWNKENVLRLIFNTKNTMVILKKFQKMKYNNKNYKLLFI
jgi:hypothetical protein